MQDLIGRTLGHYCIVEKIGEGGMGVVYRAHDERLDRDVAIKVLPEAVAADPDRLRRFEREAKAVAALSHPNILEIFDFDTEDDVTYSVTELLEGETLREHLQKERDPLPWRRVQEIGAAVANGLGAAHGKGVVHRDIKPSNIFLCSDGRVKILDFGLAATHEMVDSEEETGSVEVPLTREGSVMGTVGYMAPEQVRGEPADQRSDIFALGCVLYEMLTGERAFKRDTTAEIMTAILREEPPPVAEYGVQVSPEVAKFVWHCLEKNLSYRFQTAADVRNELEELREEVSSGAAPRSSDALFPAPPSKERGLWVSLAVVVVLLAMAVGGYLWRRTHELRLQDLRTLAVLPLTNLTGDPENDHLGEVFSSGLMYELSGLCGVQLVGRSEVASVLEAQVGASEIGVRLGVGSVVEGEILSEGERQRVVVSITDTATGFVLWSETYETQLSQLLALQQNVSRDLGAFLSIPLTSKERRRLAKEPAALTRAYALYVRGQRFLDLADNQSGPESAADNFRQAVQLYPEFASARAGLSEALWQIYQRDLDPQILEQAKEQANLALEQSPGLPAARVAVARVLRSTGQVSASIEALREALGDHPDPGQAYRELAESYERIGELEVAESYLRTATALGESDWLNWNRLGALLASLGRYGEARDAFKRAVIVAPDYIYRPLENLGTLYIFEADFDAAIETYERIPKPIPHAGLASNMATAYFFQGDMDRAVEYFALAVDLDPREAELRRNYGDVLLRLGKPEAAEEEYREAVVLMEARLSVNPKDGDFRLRRAMYGAKAGDCDNAVPEALALKDTLPKTASSAHDFAYIYALCGERDMALEAVREAIGLGISANLLRQEDEFTSLQDDPEFQALTGGGAMSP